jgi:hypothetical protein
VYHDVKGSYWLNNMKRDIAKFVEQCSTYQKVKAEHQRPARTLKQLLILKWKWGEIAMDFILGLPKAPTGEIPFRLSLIVLRRVLTLSR